MKLLRLLPLLPLPTILLLGACTSESDDPLDFAERSGEPTSCGSITIEKDGKTFSRPEFYVFDAINEQLEHDDDLRAFAGLDFVDTCDAARAFVERKNAFRAQSDTVDEEPTEPEFDAPFEEGHRIANGQFSEFQPSVDLWISHGPNYSETSGCTGFIIGPREIVTAAHCIYQDGWRPVRVNVRTGSGATQCVANCSSPTTSNAYGYRHPSYSGVGDSGDDVAVIVFPSDLPAPANTASDRLRMLTSNTWKDAPINVYGWGVSSHSGSGSGIAREGTMTVSWAGSHHFTANATGTRICKGDSGGPAVRSASGDHPLAVGIASEMAGSISDWCPYSDGFNRWTQLGPKVPWIESKIGRTCDRYTSATNSALTYARCW